MPVKLPIKTIARLTIWSTLLLAGFTLGCNWLIDGLSNPYIYTDTETIPSNKVGLVLGTSRWLANGNQNYYFTYRIDAAVKLYNEGKIQYIIVSGDNRTIHYNEPREMTKALIERGIPENKIFQDYAGLRTLDSVIRCKEIFGQNSYTIISQDFHNQRAVFIARYHSINAIAYNAKDVKPISGLKTQLREIFARVLVFVDLMTAKKPRHGGEKIIVE